MQDEDERRAALTRTAMARLTAPEGSIRDLAMRTGLSEQTIRTVTSTGTLSSMHTAAALEAATDGEISVAVHMRNGARGDSVYSVPPGSEILGEAIRRRCSPGDVLASIGLTQQDLSTYSNAAGGGSARIRDRVDRALAMLRHGTENAR